MLSMKEEVSKSMFSGLSAFPITPADPAGQVDAHALHALVTALKSADVQSVGLLGSTGTYAYLTRTERRRAVEAAADALAGAHPLIVGVGALRTDDAQALARDAEAAGADGLLLAPVSYTPLTDEEVYQHYVAVAEATQLPLCIYNNPGTTHFTFDVPLLARLAEISNIVAVKMPLPADQDIAAALARLRPALPADFKIGYSGDWGCAAALVAGADAWFSVVAGILPDIPARLLHAVKRGKVADAMYHDERLHPLWDLFQEFGSLRVVYAIANLMELTDAQPPRPILPLTSADMHRVDVALVRVNKSL